MPSVRILNVGRVSPVDGPYPAPGDTIPLCFFDTYWIAVAPIQRLFLFPKINDLPLSSIVRSLKSSLSQTLSHFHPLAGKLTYIPSSADVIIDCSGVDGVSFVEAESDADINRMVGDEDHDTEAFVGLVPQIDARMLPAPVMAVQVTEFVNGGGVAVGLTVHHAAVDGMGLWQFVEAWAAACRGEGTAAVLPVNDRAAIPVPVTWACQITRAFSLLRAPNLPAVRIPLIC